MPRHDVNSESIDSESIPLRSDCFVCTPRTEIGSRQPGDASQVSSPTPLCAAAFGSMALMDRLGRKKLMMLSFGGMVRGGEGGDS